MKTLTVARHAMATRFEIILQGENEVALRAAGEEALDHVEQIEAQLSIYRPSSEISRVNAAAASGPVRVSPPVFSLLQQAAKLSAETRGAFDISIAPLVRCWGFMGASGMLPSAEALETARATVGMHHLHFDAETSAVAFDRPGVMLDLGAIGKGYAIERAAGILRETGVRHALLHGGTSTVAAIGNDVNGSPWKIAIEHPGAAASSLVLELVDQAVSVSAVWGKTFTAEGQSYGHVLDPRSGQPVSHAILAAVTAPSATETDAFSTALLVVGSAGHDAIARLRAELQTILFLPSNGPEAIPVERRSGQNVR